MPWGVPECVTTWNQGPEGFTPCNRNHSTNSCLSLLTVKLYQHVLRSRYYSRHHSCLHNYVHGAISSTPWQWRGVESHLLFPMHMTPILLFFFVDSEVPWRVKTLPRIPILDITAVFQRAWCKLVFTCAKRCRGKTFLFQTSLVFQWAWCNIAKLNVLYFCWQWGIMKKCWGKTLPDISDVFQYTIAELLVRQRGIVWRETEVSHSQDQTDTAIPGITIVFFVHRYTLELLSLCLFLLTVRDCEEVVRSVIPRTKQIWLLFILHAAPRASFLHAWTVVIFCWQWGIVKRGWGQSLPEPNRYSYSRHHCTLYYLLRDIELVSIFVDSEGLWRGGEVKSPPGPNRYGYSSSLGPSRYGYSSYCMHHQELHSCMLELLSFFVDSETFCWSQT